MAYESLLTVLTPALSRDLTTLSSAATECGRAVGDITDLGLLISAASGAVEMLTRRKWVAESVRETFRGTGQSEGRLILRRAPVVEIQSISVDGLALNLATEVECDTEAGLLYRLDLDSRIPWQGRAVVVQYTGGFIRPGADGANLPAVVQRATNKIVAGWYHGQGGDPRVRSQTTEDVGAQSFVDPSPDDLGLPPGIAGILAPLRWGRPG